MRRNNQAAFSTGLRGHLKASQEKPATAAPALDRSPDHRRALGENYISTFAFLPLGLKPADEFWSTPSTDWTTRKLRTGTDLPADHAI